MNRKPEKGHEYDNFHNLVASRQARWSVLKKRDEYLEVIFNKVIEDNSLTEYLWQANAYDNGADSTETGIVARWKYWYPNVAGDKQYSKVDEDAPQSTCAISVIVTGTRPGEFNAGVFFDCLATDGKMNTSIMVKQDVTPVKIVIPFWFSHILMSNYTPNCAQLPK